MTDDFVAERRRRRFVLTGGLVLGLIAAVAVYFLLTRQGGNPTATPPPKAIVVAAVAIKVHTQIEANMVKTESVPDNPAWANTATDVSTVVGQVALVDIPAGAPLQENMFGTGTAAGVEILGPDETIGPDSPIWRAVSITVPADRAAGGLIGQGDHVDVIVTLAPQLYDPTGGLVGVNDPGHPALFGQVYSDSTTKVTLLNVEVLDAATGGSTYVLKVDEHQAEQIAHIQSSASNQFTLVLRPEADSRTFDPTTYGQTTNSLFNLYAFPIPVQINVASSASPGLPSPSPSGLPSGSPPAQPSPTPTP